MPPVKHGLVVEDKQAAKHKLMGLFSRGFFEIKNAECLPIAIAVKISVRVIEKDGLAVGREKFFLHAARGRADGLGKGRRVLK